MSDFVTHSVSNARDAPEATSEVLISLAEIQLESMSSIPSSDLLTLGEKLIAIYDAPFSAALYLRERAARAAARLASHDSRILERVIKNAESYGELQHCADAFPYSPNGFEVLSEIRPVRELVTSFLQNTAQHDFGVASWSAAEALRALVTENALAAESMAAGDVQLGTSIITNTPPGAVTETTHYRIGRPATSDFSATLKRRNPSRST